MSSGPTATGFPSPALVFDTLFAYQRTAALRAAIELGTIYRAAGFADIAGHAVPTGPHTVVVGHAV